MCDKKNKVLFTDTECLVLSSDFKLPDENQVLLRVPRQDNMYSFNLENIVPSRGLACLTTKATVDESNKWHRRLGHVNFKNINKLVKGNLVRGLPSKIFQNDHTCVAYTTQDFRDSLEDTNGSEGTQVQSSHDSPLSGDHTSKKAEGGLNLEELFIFYTNLSNRVLALETSRDAQAAEILKLKDQIKKLKRKLGRKEYVSKQGRKNAKPEPTLDAFDDLDADDKDYIETEDVVKEGRQSNETEKLNKGSGDKGGSTKELVSTAVPKTVSTARPELSTARPDVDAARQEDSAVKPKTPPTTTSIFDDEDITMAQILIKMKEEKAKEKGVSIKDIKDSSRLARSILTLKPHPTIDPKYKGKSVLEEPWCRVLYTL
ncbi:copia protein [Tanacetum coccineum]|uniref:Copia protein n=1 Tax=Tanacetum coccineum TaxID=301880 RepID=A0ABQ4YB14_9ASTR